MRCAAGDPPNGQQGVAVAERTGRTPSRVARQPLQEDGPGGGAVRGTAKTASMRASFRAIHGGVHVIAFALPLPRFASQTVGPVSPAPIPRRFAAAPDSGAPSTRRFNEICGSADPWSAECSRQPPAALADHGSALPMPAGPMATMDLSKVGRGGLAGALSAMDGAKRGPHGGGSCRPPPTHPGPPTHGPSAAAVAVVVAAAVAVAARFCGRRAQPGTPPASARSSATSAGHRRSARPAPAAGAPAGNTGRHCRNHRSPHPA